MILKAAALFIGQACAAKLRLLLSNWCSIFALILLTIASHPLPKHTNKQNQFSEKLKDTKFSEFATLKMEQIQLLEDCLSRSLPKLMEELPSEKDSPETLRAKMNEQAGNSPSMIPVPNRANKFGKFQPDGASNPFGFGEDDQDNYWALEESAERLKDSFEALGPVGGFLSPQVAKEVLVKTGLQKDQLRQIWNLSDID